MEGWAKRQNQVPTPALFLHGPKATGKTTLARAIASLVNGREALLLANVDARAIHQQAMAGNVVVIDNTLPIRGKDARLIEAVLRATTWEIDDRPGARETVVFPPTSLIFTGQMNYLSSPLVENCVAIELEKPLDFPLGLDRDALLKEQLRPAIEPYMKRQDNLRVFKYQLKIGENTVRMPICAEVLTCHNQHENICIWALVDDSDPLVDRHFFVAMTGHPIPYPRQNLFYIESALFEGGAFVGHVFEVNDEP